MNQTLQEAKQALKEFLTDNNDVHAVGLSEIRQAVVVYTTTQVNKTSVLYQAMVKAVAPFSLEVVVQPKARAMS
jgi:hypothetical protein